MPIARRPEPTQENDDSNHVEEEPLEEAQASIGERVQFWQEQDKINQALIPRVVHQKERLDQHIKSHEDLDQYRKTQNRSSHVAWAAMGLSVIALAISIIALVLSTL